MHRFYAGGLSVASFASAASVALVAYLSCVAYVSCVKSTRVVCVAYVAWRWMDTMFNVLQLTVLVPVAVSEPSK